MLFVPVLAASFSSHAQNTDWGGERVPIALAVERPRPQASPPPLSTFLGEDPRSALICHPNHIHVCTAIAELSNWLP